MFKSILFLQSTCLSTQQPDCFRDLGLDRLLEPMIRQEEQAELTPWYHTPLSAPEEVYFRQEVQKDLLRGENLRILDDFSREICQLARWQDRAEEDLKSGDPWRSHLLLKGHILDYGERYVRCVSDLRRRLPELKLQSRGLQRGAEAIEDLWNSPFFQQMKEAQTGLREKFDREQYCMLIKYGTVRVKKYEGETDLSERILSVFEKFRREDAGDYRQRFREEPHADHVEAAVLQCLSRVYPELFRELDDYVTGYARFTEKGLLTFCRELRFYISWLQKLRRVREDGLPVCFPTFEPGRLWCSDLYDLNLWEKLGGKVVRNDFFLEPGQRILVVTGPNQGGKTTFARAVGQLHYLASLGLCIPGSSANLLLPDRVLTHFEREETEGSGRLRDDLLRLRQVLEKTTDRSLLVINEIFSSTSAEDALVLGKQMLKMLSSRGCMGVLVTFLSELARFSPETVSMMSTVDPADPSVRTFRVIRKPPDDRTYAITLAEKHRLTYGQIQRRLSGWK